MIKLKKILFPTDFSGCADQALTHAVYLAEKYQTELHLLHVVTLFENQPAVLKKEFEEIEEMVRKIEDKAELELNNVVSTHDSKDMKIIQSQKRAISTAPAILEYASDNNIELIVMGTHGRRGIGHVLLGSVAEEVLRLSKCPVLTVRESEEPLFINAFKKVLVPIDLSEHSQMALTFAKEITTSYGTGLQLLHIIEETMHPAFSLSGKSSIFDLVPGIKEECKRRIDKMIVETGLPTKNIEIIIKGGQAAHDIIEFAKDNSSDLIIIATHGLTGIEHLLLGSVTEKVVRMSPCPVFTLKSFGKSLT
jgi:nucleotide-binding universal stress UspA family protein